MGELVLQEQRRQLVSIIKTGEGLEVVQELTLHGRQLRLPDLQVLAPCASLRKLDASNNSVTRLDGAEGLVRLETLILYRNKISDLGELLRLRSLQGLRQLDLRQNPVAKEESYRLFVIKYLPRLKRLDGANVTVSERTRADRLFANLNYSSSSTESSEQRSFSDEESSRVRRELKGSKAGRYAPDKLQTTRTSRRQQSASADSPSSEHEPHLGVEDWGNGLEQVLGEDFGADTGGRRVRRSASPRGPDGAHDAPDHYASRTDEPRTQETTGAAPAPAPESGASGRAGACPRGAGDGERLGKGIRDLLVLATIGAGCSSEASRRVCASLEPHIASLVGMLHAGRAAPGGVVRDSAGGTAPRRAAEGEGGADVHRVAEEAAAAARQRANEEAAPPPPPPPLPYRVDTSRPSLRTNWTRLVPVQAAALLEEAAGQVDAAEARAAEAEARAARAEAEARGAGGARAEEAMRMLREAHAAVMAANARLEEEARALRAALDAERDARQVRAIQGSPRAPRPPAAEARAGVAPPRRAPRPEAGLT